MYVCLPNCQWDLFFQTQRCWVWPQVTVAQGLLGTAEVDLTGWVLLCGQASGREHEGLGSVTYVHVWCWVAVPRTPWSLMTPAVA